MKLSTIFTAGSAILLQWLFAASVAAAGIGGWQLSSFGSFGIEMPIVQGQTSVDPHAVWTVQPLGYGTQLTALELKEEGGKVLVQSPDPLSLATAFPLRFGTQYVLKASVSRPWLDQYETREVRFKTVELPQCHSPTEQILSAEGSIDLHFDRPIGTLLPDNTHITWTVQSDTSRQNFKLIPDHYVQGQTYPIEIQWTTSNAISLPPLKLHVATAPPLTAALDMNGKTQLGVAMPVEFTFSEPLADPEKTAAHAKVHIQNGKDVSGKWQWINKHRLQFKPDPAWPAFSTVEVKLDPTGLKSIRGAAMSQSIHGSFTTGPDKRIVVYINTQRAEAIENGQVVKTLAVSTGKAATPTVTGSFYIYARYPTKTMRSSAKPGQKGYYVVEGVPYAQYFHEGYAFHGAWWHNGFGHPASHGCVNLSTKKKNHRWPRAAEDAGWLYQWASLGVPVIIQKQAPSQKIATMVTP